MTCAEIVGKFRKPPTLVPKSALTENHLRLRLSPEVTIAMGMMVLAPGEGMGGQVMWMRTRECWARSNGRRCHAAREDYVEEAWRTVDPVLKMSTPIYQYQTNAWGPREVERVTPMGGWSNRTSHETSVVASEAAA